MPRPVYLDNHATTRVDPRVVERMLPTFAESYGNAGSTSHAFGWEAKGAVDAARASLASLLGARPEEIVFTSGATEANNLAILGALPLRAEGRRVVTAATEHHAVLDACLALRERGAEVVVLPVDGLGRVDPAALERALEEPAALVSIMAANNEIGTIQPIAELAAICRARGVPLHCDAAQAVGRVPVDVKDWGVDLLSLSGHKFHAPKGVGALFVRRGPGAPRLKPQQHGGGQEGGLRPGTLNVHGLVGLGAAADLCAAELSEEGPRIAALRDRLQAGLEESLDGLRVNGDPAARLPGNLSLTVDGVEAEALMTALPGFAFSAGSACSSAAARPSHVLTAIGLEAGQARSTLRFGLGRFTTEEEIERVLAALIAAIRELRGAAPV